MRNKLLLSIIFGLSVCSCSAIREYSNKDNMVTISVETSDAYSILSKNPQEFKKGETARFKLSFLDNYIFKSSSDGYYENDYLIVEDVQYSETIYINYVETVSVFLETPEGCHFIVTSDNPVNIEKGTNAAFDIEFEHGYVYDESSEGEYSNNKLYIENVQCDTNVTLTAKLKGNIHLKIQSNELLGLIKINGESTLDEYGYYGDAVVLEAIPLDNKKFVCWSLGESISSAMPLSFERVYELTLTDDVVLYANFWDNQSNTIIYHSNGGSTLAGDELIYYPHVKANHIRINTIQGSNAFINKGYLLDSWNTKPDGSGTRIGLGSRVKIPNENEPLNLYAIWIKETDTSSFEFEIIDETSYAITKCTSNENVVVIPEYYNNLPITVIKNNSFNSLNLEVLYLSTQVIIVENQAITNCVNFDEIHFFDSLVSIPNDFSSTMPSKLYINANTDPCYIGSYQNLFVLKNDILSELSNKKIIFIGDSNTMYSIDGSMISDAFNSDVLCFGVQSGIGIAWELACLKSFCRNDENTIVFCNEFDAGSIGSFSEHKYYCAEGNYDLLLAIDFNELNYTNVFGAFTEYKKKKMDQLEITPYSNNDYSCDKYGCLKLNIEPYRSEDWYSSYAYVDLNFYKNDKFNWAREFCSCFINSDILYSCCAFNRNCINPDIRERFYSDYQQSIIDCVGFTVISQLSEYAFSGSAFSNDNYHLIYTYTVERTKKLINDLSSFY